MGSGMPITQRRMERIVHFLAAVFSRKARRGTLFRGRDKVHVWVSLVGPNQSELVSCPLL